MSFTAQYKQILHEVIFQPGEHGALSGTSTFRVADGTSMGDTGYQVPTVEEDASWDFIGWLGSDGELYTEAQILTLSVLGNLTFVAQYQEESSGGGGVPYYILRYNSNGGTRYKNEWYVQNTVVKLTKIPIREGYTFTGWYADEKLSRRIEKVRMTEDKTVYAGWEPTGVPDWLNGEDHFAYIIGYADGTVRPLENISRAEVATIFFRLLKEDVRESYLTTESPFTDVNGEMWCNTAIATMAKMGVLKGRSAETFDPDAPITRAEFAAICARFDTSKREGDSNFTDISGHWAEEEIERAAVLGWIYGYTDGTFRPEQPISRAEAITMINRVLNRLPEDESDLVDGMRSWPDNPRDAWHYLAVQEATNSHIFHRKADGLHESWEELVSDPDWTQYQ